MSGKGLGWIFIVVVVLLLGCQPEKQGSSLIPTENIENYLVENIGISAYSGKVFCAYKLLDARGGAEGDLYLWALCQEYYLEQGALMPGSGISLPVALQIREQDGRYEVIGHTVPRDGTYYGPDVREAFPRSTWSQIMPQADEERDQYNDRANELGQDTENQARSYYGFGTQ